MNRSFIWILSMVSFLSPSCCSAQTRDQASRAVQEDDIREAVLRYQMLGWASESGKPEKSSNYKDENVAAKHLNAQIYFVLVDGKDPTDEFLKSLADVPRTIKKASLAKQTKKSPGWVVDKKTKQPGIIFRTNEIRWTSETEAEVEGGYHCGGLCAAGDVFSVRYEAGKWKVVQARMKWIS
jgi:hypothetical protein